MTPKERGSQPAFPQHPCLACRGPGVIDPQPSPVDCPFCSGSGLVGGGLTVREWLVGRTLAGLLANHAQYDPPETETGMVVAAAITMLKARTIADAALAALEVKS